ncbi:hypothetical protein R2601_03138 [Salipiger bermudensis HTCC2601]|uniref:Uncharacterized protein n=1 Tax=Salipiger bermudensis (strain DSM 26914 / JCM 13377 / KCTC 12554 / HTCC2601) TaxID=314265 RepID=Q0FWL8_SALBH|nr:hypothetical protein R2601_03138 [Salipiger bermudensis HTCC2601]
MAAAVLAGWRGLLRSDRAVGDHRPVAMVR